MSPNVLLTLAGLCFMTAAGTSFAAIEGPVGRDAEKGDPARWYRPAETPRQQYDNAMQEAHAALAEALRECRAAREDRKACEAEARLRHEDDVERARGLLVRSTLG